MPLSCEPVIAGQIRAQGGNYLLGPKANQPSLLAEAERHTQVLPAAAVFTRRTCATDRTPLRHWVWTQTDLRWVNGRALAGPGDAGAGAGH